MGYIIFSINCNVWTYYTIYGIFGTLFTFAGPKEGVGDFGSIQRMQKGQIKGGITGDDLYLVQKDKEKDIETERVKVKELEEKKKEQEEQIRKAEEKAGFVSNGYY